MHRKVFMRFMYVLAVIGTFIWASPMGAQKGKPTKGTKTFNDPINATFRDDGTITIDPITGEPTFILENNNTPDKITSDDRGPYENGMDGVKATLTERGNFVVSPSGRKKNKQIPDPRSFTLFFLPENLVKGTLQNSLLDGTSVFEHNPYTTNHMAKNRTDRTCVGGVLDVNTRDMNQGECLRFVGGANIDGPYGLMLRCGFKPGTEGGELDATGTDDIGVTCTTHDGTACTQWTVKPLLLGLGDTERLICRLFEHRSPKGKNAVHETVVIGDFNMPHGWTVVLQ